MVDSTWDFGTEDFGLAKSFSPAPLHAIAPQFAAQKVFTEEDNRH